MCPTTRTGTRESRRRASLHAHLVAAHAANSPDRERAGGISLSPTAAACSTPMPACSQPTRSAMDGGTEAIDELLRQAGLVGAAASSTTRRWRRRRCTRCRSRSRRNAISAAPIATPSRASSAALAEEHGADRDAARGRPAGRRRRTGRSSISLSSAANRWSTARCCTPRPGTRWNSPGARRKSHASRSPPTARC